MDAHQHGAWATAVMAVILFLATGTVHAQDSADACSMLQKANVEAAFAPHKFDSGTPGKNNVVRSAKLATVSECTYATPGAKAKDRVSVALLVRRAPSDETGVTPQAAKAGAVQMKKTPVDVAGLGEGAYIVNQGNSKFPLFQLNVFKGKRVWLIFSCSGKKLDNNDAALASLTKLAQASMGR